MDGEIKLPTPEVSVVMSVYNGAKYLRESVESIIAQEGVDFEFIIVNDGSTDQSGQILNEYANNDTRIRVVHQENQGLTKSLIKGCNVSRGRYIARQDSDDISLPSRLFKLSKLLDDDPRLAFVSSWTQRIGLNDEVFSDFIRPDDPLEATRQLFEKNIGPPGHGSVMFRRNLYKRVGGYRQEFYYCQDFDLWLRLASQGLIAYEQKVLYKYRYTLDGISTYHCDIQNQFAEFVIACDKARRLTASDAKKLYEVSKFREKFLAGNLKRPSSRRRIAATYYHIGSELPKRGDQRSKELLWKAIKTNPLHWKAWVKLIIGRLLRRDKDIY